MPADQGSAGSKPRAKDRYIGREILDGQFKIIKKIGTGGMGSVYKASQPEMNRMVAVKILHAKLKNRKDLVSRFRREARAMSHLTHPNTVKVMMYGELESGELYIVMEYLEGKNLNQIVRRQGPMGVDRAIPVLLQVCGALQEAHELGMVHRDLKPENIFLTTSGGMTDFAKVLDFGLAKVTERELRPGSIMLTQEGMVFGTPEFMSPEQAQGQTLDRRSDIYSLAIILYEALTGKLPFDARSSMEYIQLHVTKPPIHLDERVPDKTFPAGLGDAIAKALAKSPDDRYDSATEFAEALMPFAPATAASAASLPGTSIPAAASSKAELTPSPPVISDPPVIKGAAEPESEPEPSTKKRPELQKAEPTAPAPTEAGGGLSSRTLILVSAISVIAGIVLAVVALKLLG
ncbi:MAG TPA: serine/threonine protein kinase [Polyangiaceae bacterium]|nr:serine/threonine protein kinase [Polyangiaceae bacterium]